MEKRKKNKTCQKSNTIIKKRQSFSVKNIQKLLGKQNEYSLRFPSVYKTARDTAFKQQQA